MIERAHAIDTIVPPSWQYHMGHSYHLLGRTGEAAEKFRETIERIPFFRPARLFLACLYAEMGQMKDARAVVKALKEIAPEYTIEFATRILPIRSDDERNRIFELARKAGLSE